MYTSSGYLTDVIQPFHMSLGFDHLFVSINESAQQTYRRRNLYRPWSPNGIVLPIFCNRPPPTPPLIGKY
jgi:hypothetical protein